MQPLEGKGIEILCFCLNKKGVEVKGIYANSKEIFQSRKTKPQHLINLYFKQKLE